MSTATTNSVSKKTGASAKNAQTSVTDKMVEAAHSVIDRVSEPMNESEKRLRDAGGNIAEKSEGTRDSVTNYVKEHPAAAVGMAFAAGVLASLIFKK